MFSFHKPRVYRSPEGCCICKAKSSSSRFTDSSKYEEDSVKCFNLDKPRAGEICNACALLVKRYKRLPVGSKRHWAHVVDARVGPGMKSMTKFKKVREENEKNDNKERKTILFGKYTKILKKMKISRNILNVISRHEISLTCLSDILPTSSSLEYTDTKNKKYNKKMNRRKFLKPKKNVLVRKSSFVDESLWKFRKFCCGFGYENSDINAVIIDSEHINPCQNHFSSILIKSYTFHKNNEDKNDKINNNTLSINVKPEIYDEENKVKILKKNDFQKYSEFNSEINFLNGTLKYVYINQFSGKENQILAQKLQIEQKSVGSKGSTLQNKKAGSKSQKLLMNDIQLRVRLNSFDMKKQKFTINSTNPLFDKITQSSIQNDITKNHPTSKFSENSSDSGFYDNMLERLNLSPVSDFDRTEKQKDRDIQTMYIFNGISIQGQKQNLTLTGNEVASNILNRRL